MTDSSFETMKAQGTLPTFKYLSEDDVKAEFDKQMIVAAEEGRTEVPRLAELLNQYLNTTDPDTGEYINFDKAYQDYIDQITAENGGDITFQ